MKRVCVLVVVLLWASGVVAQEAKQEDTIGLLKEAAQLDPNNPPDTAENSEPSWLGKYPMSFFTKTRTAKTVGKDRLTVALKIQYFDWHQKYVNEDYDSMPPSHSKNKTKMVICTKYGWARDHHIAIGIPIHFNDFDTGASSNHSRGLCNVFIFDKWNLVKETKNIPAVAVDFWYYFPTGDSDRKLGTDDGAYKITTEISKAWKDFSLHFNPGYGWNETPDSNWSEINAGAYLSRHPNLLPGLEYNYFYKENHGHSHDLVPGILWKMGKGATVKVGIPVNLESTCKYRDRIGLAIKLCKRF